MSLVKVRYKGLSDERIIRSQDLKKHGIAIDATLTWNRSNNFAVVVDGMSDELESLLRDEGTFNVEEVEPADGKTIKVIVKATRLDDTNSAVVVDETTGQKSKAK